MILTTLPFNILKQIDALDIGVGAVSALAVPGALGYALQTRNKAQTGQELLSTQNRPSAKGQAGLPKDYIGLRVKRRRCPAISASRSSTSGLHRTPWE